MSEPVLAPAVDAADVRRHVGVDRQSRAVRWSRQIAVDVVAIADGLMVFAFGLVPAVVFERAGSAMAWQPVAQAAALGSAIAVLCLKAWGSYDPSRVHDLPLRPGQTLAAIGIGVLGVAGLGQPAGLGTFELTTWYLLWLAAACTGVSASRLTAKALLDRWTVQGRFDERVAVFGAGTIARHVHDHLADGVQGIHFVGVYDDRSQPGRVNTEGLAIAGTLADLLGAARSSRVDRIIVALPAGAEKRIAQVVSQLEGFDATVHVVSHMVSDDVVRAGGLQASQIGRVGLIDVQRPPLTDWSAVAKRAEDIVVGSLLLVISLPLWPLIALAIRLESPGPVLFRQRRRGLNQKVFGLVKFRTMTVLEDGEDVQQARRGDPRVTRVGGWLRATSLDELPQLINVLKGEMSLVGPRPHALVHDEQFGEIVRHYPVRSRVKPGITGLAQVRGLRGETSTAGSIEARVAQDLAYIRNWSLTLDLKILALTVWAVIAGVNAH